MHLTTVPVIDQLIAERRRFTGYPRDSVDAAALRIAELEEQIDNHVCCCCGDC